MDWRERIRGWGGGGGGGAGGRGSAEGDRELSGYDRALQIKQYAIPCIRSSLKTTTTKNKETNNNNKQKN